ncbi:uncharacterized protein LOC127705695 isoform X4 [Mytilus californianus]|uniref:uncharacterized protein LOC127705695 isoform X3 n=1 Tax=Mytilus californianus TaxID=6549 RepID=UPI002248443D|nr:uncharacterized protein LOC127705695 isoform X3 [Mytilus californianus]XP_052066015.1 uncharacterized protein LOC127705695 isoform X4 [Mytilus californianus]
MANDTKTYSVDVDVQLDLSINKWLTSGDSFGPILRERSHSSSIFSDSSIKSSRVTESEWGKRLYLENKFHIYYQDNWILNPSDLLEKIHSIDVLNEEQTEYTLKVKSHLEQISPDTASLCRLPFEREIFDEAINHMHSLLDPENEAEISFRLRVGNFIEALRDLADDVEKYNLNDGSFTKMLISFAEMCCLRTCLTLGKGDEVVWENVLGSMKVMSIPAIRLKKCGIQCLREDLESPLVVSVVEVKKDSTLSNMDSMTDEIESASVDSDSFTNFQIFENFQSEKSTRIEEYFNSRLLGQHAGELLLNLYELTKKCDKLTKFTIPGMIVNKTEVMLTLLEMSQEHFDRLKNEQVIEESDRAVIYYSRPFDIIYPNDRNTLIDCFMRLNNIEYK